MAPRTNSISVRFLICLFRAFALCILYLFPHLHNTLLLVFPLQSSCKSISVLLPPQYQCCPFNHASSKSYFIVLIKLPRPQDKGLFYYLCAGQKTEMKQHPLNKQNYSTEDIRIRLICSHEDLCCVHCLSTKCTLHIQLRLLQAWDLGTDLILNFH